VGGPVKDKDPHVNLQFFSMLEHLRICEQCRAELTYEKLLRLINEIYGRS
jgi:hypothetical protein